ncbi:MAG: hypothetical protein WA979_03360, partial [Pacificimonas sp.]
MRPFAGLGLFALVLCVWTVWRASLGGAAMEAMLREIKPAPVRFADETGREVAMATPDIPEELVATEPSPFFISEGEPRSFIAASPLPQQVIPATSQAQPVDAAAMSPSVSPRVRPATNVATGPTIPKRRPARSAAYVRAASAYEFLRVGERREAAAQFRQALAADGTHGEAAAWRAELARLER